VALSGEIRLHDQETGEDAGGEDHRARFSAAAAGVRPSKGMESKGMEPKPGAARISMHESGRHARPKHRANRSAQ
jgi:hypothetical protein